MKLDKLNQLGVLFVIILFSTINNRSICNLNYYKKDIFGDSKKIV